LWHITGPAGANSPEEERADDAVPVNSNGNGAATEEDGAVTDKQKSADSIFITGKPEACEAAKEALLVRMIVLYVNKQHRS
jgi:hypothetical protein